MSITSRITSAFFAVAPSLVLFTLYFASGTLYKDYYWETYSIVLTVLVAGSLIFGLALPPQLQAIGLRQPWMWVITAGILAGVLALLVLALLNGTPLCVGQDNGDGNNDFGMCMVYTGLVGIVYTPILLAILSVSAFIGHWILKWHLKAGKN